MSREALEELRMVTKINTGTDEVLQFVRMDQPELNEMVQSTTQFAQRVSVQAHLDFMGVIQ